MARWLLRRVEVDNRTVDVRVDDRVVSAIGPDLPVHPGDRVVSGRGGALLPGLHDHHVHLLATAAAAESVRVGPPEVTDRAGLVRALRRADADPDRPPDAWIRAVGYHESVAGDLDRHVLDTVVADRPVRVQHRSGSLWILNSPACAALGLLGGPTLPVGAGRDGRLFRADDWLRAALGPQAAPDLTALGRRLARVGVTGVTDATPVTGADDLAVLAAAPMPQHRQVTGGPALAGAAFPAGVGRGPVKVVIADHDLPALDDLTAWFASAHDHDRPVAVHCVTAVALALALAAWDTVGVRPGDRIEHASVVGADLIGPLAERGLTVVTQPGFIAERGDQYRTDVPADEHGDLYRVHSLLAAGVPVGLSTDAPYTAPDPWAAVRAAVDRRTPTGHVLGPDERIDARTALDRFLGARVAPGGPADLVLLDRPLAAVVADPGATTVVLTIIAGEAAFRRSELG